MADIGSYMDGLNQDVSKSQGGATSGGPDSAKDPKVSGDHANPTFYTKQDDARDGRIKNKYHEV